MRGWASAITVRGEEGFAELEGALANELRASRLWGGMIGTMLAEVHLRQGRPDAASWLLKQVWSLTASMLAYYWQPELLRVEAEWLRLVGRHADARRLFLESIETARHYGTWALASRSALGLARAASSWSEADVTLLRELHQRLPADNETDHGHELRALLSASGASMPSAAAREYPR
jgi:ATP/maltotriose-dependent transcriptional regulator MalT